MAIAEDTSVVTTDPSFVAARRLYIRNIPRNVTNDDLQKIVEEHGAIEKAEESFTNNDRGTCLPEVLQIALILMQWKSDEMQAKQVYVVGIDITFIVLWNRLGISSFSRASQILNGEPDRTKFDFPVARTHYSRRTDTSARNLL
ncbi:hypothetical protein CASFOL_043025 [Castilleja foliolosa]|uniref:RRM domain-containing protein n=1 Tax=Castilleja foliolosa TaxID=1961234 RepID=A0ABD3B891_9LAMI